MVVAIVHCSHRPQLMSSQGGYLLLDAMEFDRLQRGYLWIVAVIVRGGQRPQPMKSQGGYLWMVAAIVRCGQRPQPMKS